MNRERALKKLAHKVKNPDYRTIEENAPVIKLKNGKHVMVEETFPLVNGRSFSYRVSLNFGLTCRQIGPVVSDLDGVLDLIIAEG